jgi:hypothetical protein
MLQPNEAKNLLGKLFDNLNDINSIVTEKVNEYKEIKKKLEDEKYQIDAILNEKAELENILERCHIDICKYKLAFQEIRNKYNDKLDQLISEKEFHFFLCFRKEYEKINKDVIAAHQAVIDKWGYCWVAKFYKKRNKDGKDEPLEPFGESICIDGNSSIASTLKPKIKDRLDSGRPLYLFFYNPNPPDIELYVCDVIDFYLGKEQIPISGDVNSKNPECAHFPAYYFSQKADDCQSCKGKQLENCQLAFLSNFWFKINKIQKLGNVSNEFVNLTNCFTDDNINFAIPIFYPLLVTQRNPIEYFIENVQVEANKNEMLFKITERENGHTKTKKVEHFFEKLNKACGNCFLKVESSSCERPHGPHPDLHHTEKNDEIIVCLPTEYRSDGKAMRFTVTLFKNTSTEQKQKIEGMIKDYIDNSF